MTKREAKRWAYGLAADLIRTSIDSTEAFPADEPDREKKGRALVEIIKSMYSKSDYGPVEYDLDYIIDVV